MDFQRGYQRPPGFPPRNFGAMPYYEMGNNSFGMGRGYGMSGPSRLPLFQPLRQAPRSPLRRRGKTHPCIPFLISCGVPPKYAQNLPLELMEIMEPHFCGVCDKSLPNFEEAKDHYLSKGHYKKQKKYITDKLKEPEYPPTNCPAWKVPLKSREIYCELCDVQITSKVHADSHYAGKSHKAVVYGRKPPKNKLLLCEPMSKRVTKLLRRERRVLNEAKGEDNQVVEPVVVQPETPKPINPDFYCDVCKTSVTSTEQMIMHRNGKRHLMKEKQFILKSMTGKADSSQLLNMDLVHDLKQEMEDLRKQLENAHIEIANLTSEVTTLKNEDKEKKHKKSAKGIQAADGVTENMETEAEDNDKGENQRNGGENQSIAGENQSIAGENKNANGENKGEIQTNGGEINIKEEITNVKNEWGKDPGEEWGPEDL